MVLAVTLVFGAVGWVDDYRKVINRDSRGLPARWKYFWQSMGGLGVGVYLFTCIDDPVSTQLFVPFFKNVAWQMGPLFIVLTYFVIVGASKRSQSY